MARKRAHRRKDHVYCLLRRELMRVDPKERDQAYARAWAFIAYLRARFILGPSNEDPENPGEDED